MFSKIKRIFAREPQEEDGIEHIFQKGDHDCGQICLDMLGYDGHTMFREEEAIGPEDLESIKGVEFSDWTRFDYFMKPTMIVCDNPKWGEVTHWVLAYKNKVYCPSEGVFQAKKYLNKVFMRALYQVPFNENQQT